MPVPDPVATAVPVGAGSRLVAVAAELTWVCLLWLLAALVVGLPVAVAGQFRAIPVVVVATVVAMVLRRVIGEPPWNGREGAGALAVALVVVAGVGVGNVWFAGQHHATERDPGVYLETALWLEEEGTLLPTGLEGAFAEAPGVWAGGFGFFDVDRDDGRLHPQFSHGTAVVLALADGVAGPATLARVPAMLTAFAALALWFAARPLVSPWGATLSVTILSVSLLSVHHARDTFSEPLAQALLVGAVAVLVHAGRDVRLHAIAGLAVGLGVAARIDGVIIVLGLAALVVVWGRGRHTAALVAATAAGVAIALVDLALRSEPYFDANRSSIRGPLALAAVVALGGLLRPTLSSVPAWWTDRRRRGIALIIGGLVVVGVVFALWIRPEIETHRQAEVAHIGGLQARDGLTVEPDRTYAEQSMRWLGWYLGVPALLAAAAGATAAALSTIRRGERRWVPLVALCGPVTLLYLWRPRIVGDQIWATRRFVPATLPLLAVLAAAAVLALSRRARLQRARSSAGGRLGLAVGVGAALVVVAPGAFVTAGLWNDETLHWPRTDVEALCPAVGDDAAVLVLAEDGLENHLPRTLARVCDVPVAAGALDVVDLDQLDAAWQGRDRRLVVVGARTSDDERLVEIDRHLLRITRLESSVERRPDRIERFAQEVVVHTLIS